MGRTASRFAPPPLLTPPAPLTARPILTAWQAIDGERLQGPGGVLEQLQLLDVETTHVRAAQLLSNLGFSDELQARAPCALYSIPCTSHPALCT